MKQIFVCWLLVIMPLFANATLTAPGVIDKIFAYDDYGAQDRFEGADIAVWFKTDVIECPQGVWLTPSAPGYQTIVSFLLTAYTTKQNVRFQVYKERIWSGSSSQLCQIDAIRFE
ncbi:hypothetical protein AB6E04_00920 [Vibrio amylolyticus]|uniref:hypothetical protein n=1 Tax=Vibrio amylolyticus TaxID=2847292 RepID=UPI003551BFA4